MWDPSENKTYAIAEYGFGKLIEQHGFDVLSCTGAREGKKIFGNDPDIEEIKPPFMDDGTDLLSDWVKKNPKGLVAQQEDLIRLYGLQDACIHHRTVVFTSTWKSDSINQPFHSHLYKAGAMSTFKMPHVTRLTSLEKDGASMCVGPKDGTQYDRILHKLDNDTNFKPKKVGSILVPTEDCFIQGTLMKQHFAFKCSVADYQKITLTKPMYMLEFTPDPVDTIKVCREWMQQFEDGLISIIPRNAPTE